jgi:hypothetical protein
LDHLLKDRTHNYTPYIYILPSYTS